MNVLRAIGLSWMLTSSFVIGCFLVIKFFREVFGDVGLAIAVFIPLSLIIYFVVLERLVKDGDR